MPVPTSYTESELATYMHKALGEIANALGFVDPTSYLEAINDTLLAYGNVDIATISGDANIAKLRKLAEVFAWKVAYVNASADYDFSADGGNYRRSQIFQQIEKAYANAIANANEYLDSQSVLITELDYVHDPYAYRPIESRGL